MSNTDTTPLYVQLICAICRGRTEHKADSRGNYHCSECVAVRKPEAAVSPPSATVAAQLLEREAAGHVQGGNGAEPVSGERPTPPPERDGGELERLRAALAEAHATIERQSNALVAIWRIAETGEVKGKP